MAIAVIKMLLFACSATRQRCSTAYIPIGVLLPCSIAYIPVAVLRCCLALRVLIDHKSQFRLLETVAPSRGRKIRDFEHT
jgi:hypothetical protein